MLNLNYNLIGTAKQNRNIEGFAASPRLDPYSASLVLAIPGTVFLQDYEPLFGAVHPWDDISGYISTGNVANIDHLILLCMFRSTSDQWRLHSR